MEYTVDARKFYDWIADIEPEQRSDEVLKLAVEMVQGVADKKFLITRPTKKSRKKGEVFNRPYTPEFEQFWKAYPNKSSKGSAFEIWEKLKIDKQALATLCCKALAWQVHQENWTKDHGAYIPKGENYLKGRCWEDENPKAGQQTGFYDIDGVWRPN